MPRLDCVERCLSRWLARYIGVVVACPLPFLALPLLVTAILATGLGYHKMAFVKDDLDLYTPTDAQARVELHHLDALFHVSKQFIWRAKNRKEQNTLLTRRINKAKILLFNVKL